MPRAKALVDEEDITVRPGTRLTPEGQLPCPRRSRWLGIQARRTAIVVSALVAVVCGIGGGAASIASAVPGAVAPGGAVAVRAPSGSATFSIQSLIKLLAADGVTTVADELSSGPLVTVAKPSGVELTEGQVAVMATGLANNAGITGATLDNAVPVGKGEPPFSYLLAAWVSTGTSSGAATVRALMGPQVWSQAPELVFPTITLPLFSADAAAALGVGPPAKEADRALEPALAQGPGREAMDLFSSPCSTVTNFIQETLDKVFETLKLAAPTGNSVVAKIGSFFVNLWNVAVSLAQTVVKGLVSAKGLSVVNAIVAVAGAAFTLAEVVTYLVPWSAKVTAAPASVALGANPGTFKAVIGPTGSVSYPSFVQDCANTLHISLPSLSAADIGEPHLGASKGGAHPQFG
ncbi:MAG TPA: hypothetical protein VEJ84_22920 [Acidimicrobiales bacterium]|nr:hypothetical protein [Acidimicrobiales bacterium]